MCGEHVGLLPPVRCSVYVINTEAIIHRNQVTYNNNRSLYTPVIAEQVRERYQHYCEVNRKFKKLSDRWNARHRNDDSTSGGHGWKDDMESKREKRSQRNVDVSALSSAARSMARVTRSQTSNMVDAVSATPRVCV